MKKLILFVMAAVLLLSGVNAMAATDTSSLGSSATVAATCSISSVTALDFGTYDPTSGTADDDGTGDLNFSCTKGTAWDVYITGGRTMTDGTDTLNFEIYEEAGRTTVFQNASGTNTGTAADNTTITQNLFGRIAASQDVQVGSYSGSVTVTVEY